MENILYISDVILKYIPGNWGEESNSTGDLIKVACIRGADINDLNAGIFDQLPIRYIKESSLRKNGLQVGNIIIEKSGGSPTQSTGRVAYVSRESLENRENIVCSNFCAAFSIKLEWDSQYIFYYLQYFYNTGVFFNFEGKTSGLHNLQIEQAFKAIPIKKIPLPEQKRIASVLSALDKKIALSRQINQNLEALARQLYDYWFVQFDFPNEEGKPYKSSGGKMVYNLILKREIPEGWEVKKLGELCSINKRTSNGRYNSPILYLDTASITNNNIEMLQFLDPEKDEIPSRARRVVMEGDIVYSTVRPNLKHFGLLYDPKSNMVVSTGFAVITANWSAFRYYIYQFLKQDKVVDNLHSIAQSAVSSYPSINASDIQNLDIVVPSNIQIDAFAHIACKIHAQLEIYAQQILSLTKQRDELLPLLMNGQVNFDLSDD